MQQFTYTITDPVGIHARPAGPLVKAAKALDSTITVEKVGVMAQNTASAAKESHVWSTGNQEIK